MLEAGRLQKGQGGGQSTTLDHEIGGKISSLKGYYLPVLEVSLLQMRHGSRNSNGSPSVGDTSRELADVSGFVASSETEVVVVTVNSNVLHMSLAHLLDGFFDMSQTAVLSHGLS